MLGFALRDFPQLVQRLVALEQSAGCMWQCGHAGKLFSIISPLLTFLGMWYGRNLLHRPVRIILFCPARPQRVAALSKFQRFLADPSCRAARWVCCCEKPASRILSRSCFHLLLKTNGHLFWMAVRVFLFALRGTARSGTWQCYAPHPVQKAEQHQGQKTELPESAAPRVSLIAGSRETTCRFVFVLVFVLALTLRRGLAFLPRIGNIIGWWRTLR